MSKMIGKHFIILCLLLIVGKVKSLYPRESLTREIKILNDVWNFRICHQDDQNAGFREQWFKAPLYEVWFCILFINS